MGIDSAVGLHWLMIYYLFLKSLEGGTEDTYNQWRPTAEAIPIETHGFGSPFAFA